MLTQKIQKLGPPKIRGRLLESARAEEYECELSFPQYEKPAGNLRDIGGRIHFETPNRDNTNTVRYRSQYRILVLTRLDGTKELFSNFDPNSPNTEQIKFEDSLDLLADGITNVIKELVDHQDLKRKYGSAPPTKLILDLIERRELDRILLPKNNWKIMPTRSDSEIGNDPHSYILTEKDTSYILGHDYKFLSGHSQVFEAVTGTSLLRTPYPKLGGGFMRLDDEDVLSLTGESRAVGYPNIEIVSDAALAIAVSLSNIKTIYVDGKSELLFPLSLQ